MHPEPNPLREKLIQLLICWQSGGLTAEDVHHEAEALLEAYGWKEADRSDPASIESEVLAQLDVLNQQLIIEDDIPAMVRFLRAPAGKEVDAWRIWEQYWSGIDLAMRRRLLKDSPFYAS